MVAILFILFAGLAIGCALSMVAQRNPLYGAISLIGVFISLACLYVTLAAPFIAAGLFAAYHSGMAIALYLLACGVITIIAVSLLRDYTNKDVSRDYDGV